MVGVLPGDVWDNQRLQRYFVGLVEPGDPVHAVAWSMVRQASTMVSATRVAERLRVFLRYCGSQGLEPLALTRDDLEEWIASMRDRSPETQRMYLGLARAFFEEAVDRDLVGKNPTRRMRVGRFSRAQVPALGLDIVNRILRGIIGELSYPDRGAVAARDYFVFSLGLSLGLRASEMLRLTVDDLRPDADPPTVRTYGKFRKHAERRMPVHLAAAYRHWTSVLEHTLGRELRPDDALVIALNGPEWVRIRTVTEETLRPMSRPALYNLVRNRLQDAGVEGAKLGSHRLRKTAATQIWHATKDAKAVQSTLGHEHLSQVLDAYVVPEQNLTECPADSVPLVGLDD